MRKLLIIISILIIPFIAQAPEMFKNTGKSVDLATKIKIEPEVMINTDIEHKDDSYYVVKTWGRYKVINVDDVLEVPEFFRRKSEAIEFAKNMNSEHYATPALYTN